ncbi:tetratricopeptide repeat protein [Haliangium ochraceum]|uniref:Uncharacterized protein n=1 Tax=Haliangium ochraceum (strain DSM 14365 / JCM 11303 / SMP-2) TaxID=502025 RepID=D0LR92_HALO1|nr:tetratricopeptide repeat protein [Haliangium ochraceum]ACY17120.1 hypothetical protein Hoch_4629 [Haliangium ochraceum DSM 14365]
MSATAARVEVRQQLAEARACLAQGRLAVAFASYDELLRRGNESGDAWLVARAYAGRGEIKLAQGWLSAREPHLDIEPGAPLAAGELPGALEDLQAAVAADPGCTWAWAHLAEAHRLSARDFLRSLPPRRFLAHIAGARAALATLRELVGRPRPWIAAHEAAVDVHQVCRLLSIDLGGQTELAALARTADAAQVREIERLYERAEQRLREALAAEPGYAWAKRFLAYVLTMRGSFEAAAALIDELSAAAGREDAPSACMMSLLCRYAAAQKGEGQGEERERLLQRALSASMVAAQDNHEDFMAAYAHAASCVDAGLEDAAGVVRDARARILNLAARAVFMAFALHRSVGQDERSFLAIFDETMRTAHLDVETLGIAQRDPAWRHPPSELVQAFEGRPLLSLDDGRAGTEEP